MKVELDAEEEEELEAVVYDTNPEAAVHPWERTTPLEATADETLSVDTVDTDVAADCDTRELVEDWEEAYCVTLEMEVEMDVSERAEAPSEDDMNAKELEDTEVAAVCDTRELVEDSEEAYCATLEMEVEMDVS